KELISIRLHHPLTHRHHHHPLYLTLLPPPQRSSLFPYTTLFRSEAELEARREVRHPVVLAVVHLHPVGRHRRVKVNDGENDRVRSEEHTSELQSQSNLVCRLLLEKKKKRNSCRITSQGHTTSAHR